jgi:hypothetical protein
VATDGDCEVAEEVAREVGVEVIGTADRVA